MPSLRSAPRRTGCLSRAPHRPRAERRCHEGNRRDGPTFDLQKPRMSVSGSEADGLGLQISCRRQARPRISSAGFDHVVIGEECSLWNSRSRPSRGLPRAAVPLRDDPRKKTPEERVVEKRMARCLDFLAGENVTTAGTAFFTASL